MGALGVIVCQPFSDPGACQRSGFKCVEIYAFIFQGPPEPLDHTVINPAAFAIHGYLYARIFQCLRPFKPGKLATLIAVHNRRLAIFADGLFQGFYAKIGFHAVGQPRKIIPCGCTSP